ncbi:MAG: aromatic ring-hydroxylating oxygenase subunit alpha [Flavobacteriaceae bacterium]
MEKYYINPDIKYAETLPASFYRSDEAWDFLQEQLFARSTQWLGDYRDFVNPNQNACPLTIFQEPLIAIKGQNQKLDLLSNVCTHRGNIILHQPGQVKNLKCMYHGRQFKKDGSFLRMPEFEDAQDFPRPCDNLKKFKTSNIGPFHFVSFSQLIDIDRIIEQMNDRIGFLPLDSFKRDVELSKDYIVNSHWALYCDNYLEGFHIPFVHEDLNEVLDYGSYDTVLYEQMNLQIGYSDEPKDCFSLPEGHPDYGKNVAAYYYWVFPNMMFNFYPWGLSVNIVKPINKNRTKVSFISYVCDYNRLDSGAGALLDKVEREDEFVVENVHKGLKSQFYKNGRFSPTREQGVHHFHRLLSELF